ncbi:MAG: hypothetical protein HYZ79_02625, partial [Candidatus Melainabacteria bacterium]|nr:hypothetical protein [Candidatus Melainabacteria bacterium]
MKKIFLFVVIAITLLFYLPSLTYSVKLYDELNIIKENYLPICNSFAEMIELIKHLGLNYYVESTNTLYSNIYSLRCNPFGNLLQLFIQILFKKNTFLYHAYSICLHLINTSLVFLMLNKASLIISRNKEALSNSYRLAIVAILSLFWALHPANIESILLITNANIVLSYTLVFSAMYCYLSSYSNESNNFNLKIQHYILITACYLPALFIAEFHFLVPAILIAYSLGIIHSSGFTLKLNNFKASILSTLPFITCVVIFIVFFLFSNTRINTTIYNSQSYNNIQLLLERIFWFAPQVMSHLIKLTLAPIKLSIDQSHLVIFGQTLFSPYAICCIAFMLIITFLGFISFFKNKPSLLYILIIPFLISLMPFSHILAPLYNITSERYLYLPSFIFIFGLTHFIIYYASFHKTNLTKVVMPLMSLLLIAMTIRAHIRKVEWEDNISLYKAAIKATDNPLFKAFRYKGLTPTDRILIGLPEFEVDPKYRRIAITLIKEAIKKYKHEKKLYQDKTPAIVKSYGLDPATFYAKSGYFLAQTDFTINTNPEEALKIISNYASDLSLFDSSSASFYAS